MNHTLTQRPRRSPAVLAAVASAALFGVPTPHAAIVGQWDFDAGNLAATVGTALSYVDGDGATTQTDTQFQTVDIGGQPAKVMRFPACIYPMGYAMLTPANPNGDGFLVNQWTLIMDVMFPTESDLHWRALIETDGRAINPDADMFVNTSNGLGISSVYHGVIQPNVWHRVAFSVDQGQGGVNLIRKYIDGVEVGIQAAGGLDGRWALMPGGTAELFNDDDGDVATGYVNSIQFHDAVLTPQQIGAYGGATAAGLPTAIPSSIQAWIPSVSKSPATTKVGVVINDGGTTIADGSIVLKLDGTAVADRQITRDGDLITVQKPTTVTFQVPSKHTLQVDYTDSLSGAHTGTHEFDVVLFFEDFESLVLGPNVDEGTAGTAVWTKTPPTGWTVDNSGMQAAVDDESQGVTEWEGWGFADRAWWVSAAGDQQRSYFTKGVGTVAIADPDEWDDKGNPDGTLCYFNSVLQSPQINISAFAANTLALTLDSSWRPEGADDVGPDGLASNDQTAVITVTYDGGTPIEVLHWDSLANSPTFHADNENESLTLELKNPAGAQTAVLTFSLLNAGNDWWWAVDNIAVTAGHITPTIVTGPQPATRVAGAGVSFNVAATGTSLQYQWQKDSVDIPGATTTSYAIAAVTKADAGKYRCVVTNPAGTATSDAAVLTVLDVPDNADSLKNGLAVYLPFDTDFNDASGNGKNGTAMGSPTLQAGRVGSGAVRIATARETSEFNYVTLGSNADLPFGQSEDFTVAFWVKVERLAGDPSFVATKNWGSGGNTGWSVGSQTDGRIEWNYKRSEPARRDLDLTSRGNLVNNGEWSHVAVVWHINGTADTYYNGELVDSRDISPGTGDISDPGLSLNLGEDGTGAYGGGEWDGLLDDVAIWTRGLTADEVLTLYTYGYFGDSFLTSPALTSQLGALLKFEGDFTDASGNGVNGTPVGSPSFAAGRIGQAARLNTLRTATESTFNYVSLGNAAKARFGDSSDFSVSFWVKMNEWGGDPAFIANKDWGSGNNTGWVIATDGDGRVQWNYRRKDQTRYDFDSVGGIVTDLGWHHVAVVYNIAGDALTYLDGTEVALDRSGAAARRAIGPATGLLLDPAMSLNIGQDGTGHYSDSDLFDALMDDVALWNRALSGREVAIVYGRGLTGKSVDGTIPAVPPTLACSVAGAQLTLAWTGDGFTLQQNGDLGNAAGWTAVAGSGPNSAAVPMTGTAQFFRLKK